MKKIALILLFPMLFGACSVDIDEPDGFDKEHNDYFGSFCVSKDSASHSFDGPYDAGDSNPLTLEVVDRARASSTGTADTITTNVSTFSSTVTMSLYINGGNEQSISIQKAEFARYQAYMVDYLVSRLGTGYKSSDDSETVFCNPLFWN